MSDRPHRQGKPNKKYLCQDYLGDESLPSTPSASDSSSDFDTSNTIPKGQSPERSKVFNRWNKDHHSDRQQLEHAFKNAFKKGHDRYQRKCQRASTSRQSQDPARTNTDPEVDNGDNQQ
ncbi:hypothetical protein SprV_0100300000 [Sparganum proliferum]